MPVTGSQQLFRRVLVWGAVLIGAVGVVASLIGWLVAGGSGVASAVIGAGMTLVFVTLTALSIRLGGKLSLGGFFGVVLGGWIFKMVAFLAFVYFLRQADFINGPVLFGTLVVSILGSLALDSWVFLSARIPIGE